MIWYHSFMLTFFLSFPDTLNVTTRLGLSIISSPVAGFLPLR